MRTAWRPPSGALAFFENTSIDKRRLNIRLRSLLHHPNPNVVTAIDGLRKLEDRTVRDRVVELLDHDPTGFVRAHALIYLRMLFPDAALPLLLDALDDADGTLRFTAVDQLDELEQFTDRATFERMLNDPEETVREHGSTAAIFSIIISLTLRARNDRARTRRLRAADETRCRGSDLSCPWCR